MNKKIYLPFLAVALMLAGCVLSSCSSNNDELKKATAKTATLKSALYIMDPMLDYCDITVTIGGETTTLTASNTTTTTYMGYNVRKYDIVSQSYTSFPQTIAIDAKCQAKEGYDLKSLGKSDYCFCIVSEIGNDNNDTFDHLVNEDSFLPTKNYKFDEVDEAKAKSQISRRINTTITFNTASSADVAYKLAKLQ